MIHKKKRDNLKRFLIPLIILFICFFLIYVIYQNIRSSGMVTSSSFNYEVSENVYRVYLNDFVTIPSEKYGEYRISLNEIINDTEAYFDYELTDSYGEIISFGDISLDLGNTVYIEDDDLKLKLISINNAQAKGIIFKRKTSSFVLLEISSGNVFTFLDLGTCDFVFNDETFGEVTTSDGDEEFGFAPNQTAGIMGFNCFPDSPYMEPIVTCEDPMSRPMIVFLWSILDIYEAYYICYNPNTMEISAPLNIMSYCCQVKTIYLDRILNKELGDVISSTSPFTLKGDIPTKKMVFNFSTGRYDVSF